MTSWSSRAARTSLGPKRLASTERPSSRAAATRSTCGLIDQSVPSSAPSARRAAATWGGTAKWCRMTRENSAWNMPVDPPPPAPANRCSSWPSSRSNARSSRSSGRSRRSRTASVAATESRRSTACSSRRQRVARTGVEPADGPEVEEREPPGLVDEDVALVQVGVEHPGDQHLPQHGPQQPVGHLLPQRRVHRRQQWGGTGDRRSRHPLHDDEPRGAELPVGVRDDDAVARVEAGGDGGVVGELDGVVELLVEAGREPLGE